MYAISFVSDIQVSRQPIYVHSDIRSDNDLRVALLQAAEALTPGRREGAAAKLILKLGSSHRNKLNSNGEHNLGPSQSA